MIKAIETEYNGYLFRSRLEARWAVFFDELNIKYEYEPEGFVLADGTHYLPDFFLPDFFSYFEVKPLHIKGTDEEDIAENKLEELSADSGFAGMICYGDPMDNSIRLYCYDQKEDTFGFCSGYFDVTIGTNPYNDNYPRLFVFDYADSERTFFADSNFQKMIPATTATSDDFIAETRILTPKVFSAREKARQARFEHGETPVVSVPQPTNVYHCPTKEERAKMAFKFAMEYQSYDVSMGGDKNLNHLPDIKELYYPFLAKQGIEKPDWYGGTTEIQNFFREKKENIMGEILEHDPYITEDEMLAKTHFSKTMIHKFLLKRRGI